MPTEPGSFSLESARALVAAADAIHGARPWEVLENEDIFALQEGPGGDLWAVGVMGAAKEVYGLNLYRGVGGIQFLSLLVDEMYDDPDEQFEAWAGLDGFSLEFVAKRDLEGGSRGFLERAGIDLEKPGGRRWPEFRRLRPNYPPRALDADEVRELTGLLQCFLEAYKEIAKDPSMIAWDSLGLDDEMSENLLDFFNEVGGPEEAAEQLAELTPDDLDEDADLFALDEDEDLVDFPGFPVWVRDAEGSRLERRDLEGPRLSPANLDFGAETVAELRRRMNRAPRGVWEIGACFLGLVNPEEGGGEAGYAEAIVVVEGETGRILGAGPGLRANRPDNLRRVLEGVFPATNALPARILCNQDGFFLTLKAFGDEFGIEVDSTTTPLLGEALADLREKLGRSDR